jgi:hypothetical protein
MHFERLGPPFTFTWAFNENNYDISVLGGCGLVWMYMNCNQHRRESAVTKMTKLIATGNFDRSDFHDTSKVSVCTRVWRLSQTLSIQLFIDLEFGTDPMWWLKTNTLSKSYVSARPRRLMANAVELASEQALDLVNNNPLEAMNAARP